MRWIYFEIDIIVLLCANIMGNANDDDLSLCCFIGEPLRMRNVKRPENFGIHLERQTIRPKSLNAYLNGDTHQADTQIRSSIEVIATNAKVKPR